ARRRERRPHARARARFHHGGPARRADAVAGARGGGLPAPARGPLGSACSPPAWARWPLQPRRCCCCGTLAALCTLKLVSWCVALGSGTSGGTLAPLLTVGAGLGALLG